MADRAESNCVSYFKTVKTEVKTEVKTVNVFEVKTDTNPKKRYYSVRFFLHDSRVIYKLHFDDFMESLCKLFSETISNVES